MKVKYRDLTEKDIPSIIEISSAQFGHEYINSDQILKYLKDQKTHIPVVENEGKLIGYSIIHIFKKEELIQHLGINDSSHFETISNKSIIQFRKSTAIHPDFMGKGIGSEFVQCTMKKFSEECNYVISLNWKKKNLIPMNRISTRLGMNLLTEIPNYWHILSLQSELICPECGPPSCRCSALIYIKNLDRK